MAKNSNKVKSFQTREGLLVRILVTYTPHGFFNLSLKIHVGIVTLSPPAIADTT